MSIFPRLLPLAILVLSLVSCGGGGGGGGNDGGGSVNDSILSTTVIRSVSAKIEDCPNGGVEIDIGIDANANGTLELSEISRTETICHGADGTAGQQG